MLAGKKFAAAVGSKVLRCGPTTLGVEVVVACPKLLVDEASCGTASETHGLADLFVPEPVKTLGTSPLLLWVLSQFFQ